MSRMSSKAKTISYYVEGPNWAQNVELDVDVFDTLPSQLFEAGARAIEQEIKKSDNFNLGALLIIKKSKKAKSEILVNAYICLVNAAQYKLAEDLRANYKKEHGADLAVDEQGFSEE